MRLFLPFSSRFFFYRVNLQPLGRIGFYQGGNCNSANRSSSRDHLHLSSFEHFAYAVFYTRQIAISDIGGSKDCNLFARRSTLFTPPFLFFLLLFFSINWEIFRSIPDSRRHVFPRSCTQREICIWWKLSSNQIHPVSALNPDNY